MGQICAAVAEPGTRLKVKVLFQELDTTVTEDNRFDPSNARIRIDG